MRRPNDRLDRLFISNKVFERSIDVQVFGLKDNGKVVMGCDERDLAFLLAVLHVVGMIGNDFALELDGLKVFNDEIGLSSALAMNGNETRLADPIDHYAGLGLASVD
jgi:hypothetical protein